MPLHPFPEDLPPTLLIDRLRFLLMKVALRGRSLLSCATGIHGLPGSAFFETVQRAIRWAMILGEVLAGSTILEIGLRRRSASKAAVKPTPRSLDPRTQIPPRCFTLPPEPTEAAELRAAFRHPIGHIVADLCADLGVTKGSRWWPTELIAITHTPAQWATLLRATPNHPDAETLADLAPLPPGESLPDAGSTTPETIAPPASPHPGRAPDQAHLPSPPCLPNGETFADTG